MGCDQAGGCSSSVLQDKCVNVYENVGCQDGSYLVDGSNVFSTPAAKSKSGTPTIDCGERFSHQLICEAI